MSKLDTILNQEEFSKEDIIYLLSLDQYDQEILFKKSKEVKANSVGNKVYLRGLVEYSNVCAKNCKYCGIRRDNKDTHRYTVSEEEVVEAAIFAHKNNFSSFIMQSGELTSNEFVNRITHLLKAINKATNNELGITLSMGEQTEETYKAWYKERAQRYLLRIESTNRDLYYQIHPKDELHSFEKRLAAIERLQKCGYQTGTGVMIGLPNQTLEDLANDLLFFKSIDIDMIGMGPYLEHENTPMYAFKDQLLSIEERFRLSMKMIAILRIMMPNINIASSTALQAIDHNGRERGVEVGANVLMPNITPGKYRDDYRLYQNKPNTMQSAEDSTKGLEERIEKTGNTIGFGEWGNPKHFYKRTKKEK